MARCSTWKELLEAIAQELHGAAGRGGDPAAKTYREAENLIFRRAQQDSFPEEISLLKARTNFRGGEREMREVFAELSSDLKQQLAKQWIAFNFNPPAAPHFGGVWEWEIHSEKTALYTTVGAQPVTEEVLWTVLLEVEWILNSKPLGYISSSLTDLDPVTPNVLLMALCPKSATQRENS
ncbi:hypothetical protein SKAU_G00342210 [Synaphobranchus kaupii]|uniref:Uncharacterized protein n=1 Tax=Synaphobranchus kaupii TaxID=118154 RepID=A0A9Q1EN70_SYNKA|nr:hypothetical protein SKAU_G00342210 [Synaphobranchus kaupii]